MKQRRRRKSWGFSRFLLNFSVSALLIAGIFAGLSACARKDVSGHANRNPAFDLSAFFDGNAVAYGIFEDRFGNLRRQFRVNLSGRRDGNQLILDEDFLYDDGERANRTWTIDRQQDFGKDGILYEGRAADVEAVARGTQAGNTLNWQYDVVLDMSGMSLKVHFDDWIYKQDEDIAINRAYVTKYGVDIGSVTIVFIRGKTALPLWPLQLDQWPSQ
jgi:hypothetical protein